MFPRKEASLTRTTADRLALFVAGIFLLSGCDQLSERAGFPNPARIEAEGKAIGGACRHAGRGLEDCYRLNREASKPAIYAGWKEMNEYMAKNGMQSVEPTIPPDQFSLPLVKKKKKKSDDTTDAEATAKKAADGEDTEKNDSGKH